MPFQIHALDADQFADLFTMTADELKTRDAMRVTADQSPGFPCRVSLVDADVGEELILLNYQHVSNGSPYAARHAISVRAGATTARPAVGVVPPVLASRVLSLRGFDAAMMMQEADVVDGPALKGALTAMFANPAVTEVHIHNAKPGCFAAKATRVS